MNGWNKLQVRAVDRMIEKGHYIDAVEMILALLSSMDWKSKEPTAPEYKCALWLLETVEECRRAARFGPVDGADFAKYAGLRIKVLLGEPGADEELRTAIETGVLVCSIELGISKAGRPGWLCLN